MPGARRKLELQGCSTMLQQLCVCRWFNAVALMPVVSCILPALIAFSIDVLQVQSTLLLPLFISPRRSGCVGVLEVVQVGLTFL